jgi:eukaryotic-like serine/threonine-protein kinase
MAVDSRVQELLGELDDSRCTPEQVCAGCPELLSEVRRRWLQICAVKAEVHALFPTPGSETGPGADAPVPWHSGDELPQIPGYDVEALLGRGGMGIVYKARHRSLNRMVALKMLIAGAYAGQSERARFQREAEAVANLQHANIVTVYHVGDHEGCPYFTMELLEGGSLARALAGTPLPARQAAALLITVAEAVQAAHRAGIVHRDVKPGNILLTAEGAPKVADFGLARPFGGQSALTLSGARMGTPSYMAPEQVIGKTGTIGPATDIYALGAVLYEMLTGRPPFRAETVRETERQVITEEPVPPARLNPKVPRDLETICLKCLHKDPQRRYGSAAALADDLRRFGEGRPIQARRLGWGARSWRCVRRNPVESALVATALTLVGLTLGGGLWLAIQQAQWRDGIEAELRAINGLEQQARWTDAGVALQRAEARLNGGRAGDLRQRLKRVRSDLVVELDRIHLNRATSTGDLTYYKSKADREYLSAFEKSGLARVQDPPTVVASRVNASAVRVALIAALDDWTICATDKSRRDWLLIIARQTDPQPPDWGDRIRDSAKWNDRAALSELAENVPMSGQSVSLLLTLGQRLQAAGGNPQAFLKRVQREHPADFWANISLGNALCRTAPVEANGYYRAALASRPEAAVAYTALGDSLRLQKRLDEAIGYYLQALEIDPTYARGQTNLGNVLKDVGRTDEAIACYGKALEIDPNYAWAYYDLANALKDAGRYDEALEYYRRFHAIGPTIQYVENVLRSDLIRQGRGEEVRQEWKKVLALDPPHRDAWFGYAELCLFLGLEDEYRVARRDLLRRFGDTSYAYFAQQVARAALLTPPSEEELRTAVLLAERAVAGKSSVPEWVHPYILFAVGLAEYRQGHFDRAISIMKGDAANVLGPCPSFVTAMARHRLGNDQQARTTLATAISTIDWRLGRVRRDDQWLWHVLRREAEALIFPNTAVFLEGNYEPRDNTERLALLGVCCFRNRTWASARIFADAFATDATLAGNLRFNHRYNAARMAAMAGCGHGEDATGLGQAERRRWRDQAREWLKADLLARVQALDFGPTAARAGILKALTRWWEEPDLACVREPGELEKLNADERKEYEALWQAVGHLLSRAEEGE